MQLPCTDRRPNRVHNHVRRQTRRALLLLVGALILTFTARADEKLPSLKVGLDVYSNVTVTAVTPTDIYFTCDTGLANAKLKNLDPAMQKHFQYNPAKALAAQQKLGAPNTQTPPTASATGSPTIDRTNAKAVLDDALDRVKAIVNQPVRQIPVTPDMQVMVFSPGWFHPGALRPEFNFADVRTTQDCKYGNYQFVSSDLNPGVAFAGSQIEFNSLTKYFYTDRSLPKKKLTEAEMLEINRLYRIIGTCEDKLKPVEKPEPLQAALPAFLSLHRKVVIETAAGVLLLLLVVRFLSGRRSTSTA